MMDSQQQETTQSILTENGVERWRRQRREAVALKLDLHLQQHGSKRISNDLFTYKDKIQIACSQCGGIKIGRAKDFLVNSKLLCRSCATKIRMKNIVPSSQMLAAAVQAKKQKSLHLQIGMEWKEYQQLRRQLTQAKNRCTNKNAPSWKNYGGRGITFGFGSIPEAIRWVWMNLGSRPLGTSLDRIDNNKGYEPDNLQYATRLQQSQNQRKDNSGLVYHGNKYGTRLRSLLQQRPDYTYEGLRKYINLGWTDEQILTLKKPSSGRPRSLTS